MEKTLLQKQASKSIKLGYRRISETPRNGTKEKGNN
jgi:hypothetical protein